MRRSEPRMPAACRSRRKEAQKSGNPEPIHHPGAPNCSSARWDRAGALGAGRIGIRRSNDLTATPSQRLWDSPRVGSCRYDPLRFAPRLDPIPPLPWGERRGAGKRLAAILTLAPSSAWSPGLRASDFGSRSDFGFRTSDLPWLLLQVAHPLLNLRAGETRLLLIPQRHPLLAAHAEDARRLLLALAEPRKSPVRDDRQ